MSPTGKSSEEFYVRCLDRWLVCSDHAPGLAIGAKDETEARRLCDVANIGYRLGFSIGETELQTALRRLLGLP